MKGIDIRPLGEIASDVFETPRFGRIPVEDSRYGTAFMSISDLARLDPDVGTLISTRQVEAMRARVKAGWLILPRVGQLQGLFGHVVCVAPHLDGVAVSDNNIRIVPQTPDDSGYLFAALTTDVCYWQVIRRACGTSIPYLDSARVSQVPIPWPEKTQRCEIAALVNTAMDIRSQAVTHEKRAVSLVEQWIESGGQI
jgi:type I restriction enzyme S subunit